MLKLMIPSILLIMMHQHKWWSIMNSIIILMMCMMGSLLYQPTTSMVSTSFMLDNMSISLMLLTLFISAMMLMASMKITSTSNMSNMFSLLVLLLMFILLMAFMSTSIMMFYIWFEASLIPTLFIILIWGYQPERMQASLYLMMYTLSASLPMLIMILYMWFNSKSLNMNMLQQLPMSWSSSILWLMLITGFLVKLPMYATHLWLPKAHVEAPIAGSMILAAVLLKLGGYGLIRMTMMNYWSMFPKNFILILSSLGALLTSLICMRQPDMKSMIAYSSVSHMGLLIAGSMTHTTWGINGSILMMVAHGLVSSSLFILANISYMITNTRSSFITKGMQSMLPQLSMWWFLLLAANMAAPPSINLLSEIMLITSILSMSLSLMIVMAAISFFSAVYSLHLFTITQHGQPLNITNPLKTMNMQEFLLLLSHMMPVIALILKPEIMMIW